MMAKRKIQRTPKGQWTITIPKDWEGILKLKPKDNFEWLFVDKNSLELKRVIKKSKKKMKVLMSVVQTLQKNEKNLVFLMLRG